MKSDQIVLFVCSGNICRSPFAEGYLRHRLGDGVDIRAASGGTLGIEGSPASPETLRIAREMGFDLSRHRSRGLTLDRVDEADWVLVMEEQHRRTLSARYPEDAHKVSLLSAYHPSVRDAETIPDIFDPIGRPFADFRQCFGLIQASIDGFRVRELERRG